MDPGDDDPFDRLDASHRRHDEEVAALLDAAARLADGRGRPGDLDAVAEAIAYFERSVPRHFADEESSLFPRLARRAPELAAALDRLAAEHRDHEERHARLRERWEAWDGERPSPEEAAALRDEARALEHVYRRHVEEEDALFARARAVLDPGDRAAVASDMAARRGRGGGGGGRGGGGGGGGGRRGR